jgi:predicted O-methyltransferase YrrM
MGKNYTFTQNWFGSEDLEKFLFPNSDKIDMLEIGSFEGKSTFWFLENILLNNESTITCIDPWTSYTQNEDSFNTYGKDDAQFHFRKTAFGLFMQNLKLSELEHKVIIKEGMSCDELPKLITEQKQYDIIFIDGNHTSPFVLTDAVMSWYLLKKGGMIIFDDYMWGDIKSTNSPKIAVDSFMMNFKNYIETISVGWRMVIKKIK